MQYAPKIPISKFLVRKTIYKAKSPIPNQYHLYMPKIIHIKVSIYFNEIFHRFQHLFTTLSSIHPHVIDITLVNTLSIMHPRVSNLINIFSSIRSMVRKAIEFEAISGRDAAQNEKVFDNEVMGLAGPACISRG
jgi:hypothetical protein